MPYISKYHISTYDVQTGIILYEAYYYTFNGGILSNIFNIETGYKIYCHVKNGFRFGSKAVEKEFEKQYKKNKNVLERTLIPQDHYIF